jgi:CpeT protein
MAGDFSNAKQSRENPQQFAHIRIYFRPLPFDFFNAIGFYSEQVYDHDLWSPYRQGIHRLVDHQNQVYIENYGLDDPIQYAGAARELSILKTITPNAIQRRYHCSMVFKKEGGLFRGGVEPGNQCLIEKRGCQTYLISEVEITETTWSSIDRGLDVNTNQQVWGSMFGPLLFEKCSSFESELPNFS